MAGDEKHLENITAEGETDHGENSDMRQDGPGSQLPACTVSNCCSMHC